MKYSRQNYKKDQQLEQKMVLEKQKKHYQKNINNAKSIKTFE